MTDHKNKMRDKLVYKEITAPSQIVFINTFSDKDENMAHPPAISEPAVKTFDSGHQSMQEEWNGPLDQLTKYLAHTTL